MEPPASRDRLPAGHVEKVGNTYEVTLKKGETVEVAAAMLAPPSSYSHRKKSTGGISSRKLSTIRISISGTNHRAHRSHGTFAAPSTPIVTALVGRIGFTNSHNW